MIKSTKKETVIIIAILSFLGGFLTGIVYSAYKSPMIQTQYSNSEPVNQETQNFQQLEEQINALKQQVEADPESIDLLIRLGDIYLDNERYLEAILTFNKAEIIEPENIHVLNDLGILSMNIGEYDVALEKFNKVLEIDPNHSHSLYYVGTVYRDKGETDKAIDAFEKVLTLNPGPQLAENVRQEIATLKGNFPPQ